MAALAKYVVQLEAQTAKYQRQLERANRKTSKFQKQTLRALRLVKGAFGILAGGASLRGLTRLIGGLVDADDKMAKLAVRLGSTAGDFSEFEHVAALSGIRFETLTMGLQRMTRRLAEAAVGTGEAIGALKELNLSAGGLKLLSLDAQFEAVADALAGVTNDADRVRLAMKLFDSEGVALVQTMRNGAKGIREMRAEARRLGLSLTNEQALAAEKAKDEMHRLDAAIRGMTQRMSRRYTPALANFAEALNNLINPSARDIGRVQRELEGAQSAYEALIKQALDPQGFFPEAESARAMKQLDAMNVIIAGLERELLGLQATADAIALDFLDELDLVQIATDSAEHVRLLNEDLKETRNLMRDAAMLDEVEFFPKGFAGMEQTESERLLEDWNRFIDGVNDRSSELESTWQDLGMTFASAFENAIVEGGKLKDIIHGLAQDMIRLIVRQAVTVPLANAFVNAFSGRALGGPVSGGEPYIVGERGPEVFVPNGSGRIIPNGAGGGGVSVNYTIDARGVDEASVMVRMVPLLERTHLLTLTEVKKQLREGRL